MIIPLNFLTVTNTILQLVTINFFLQHEAWTRFKALDSDHKMLKVSKNFIIQKKSPMILNFPFSPFSLKMDLEKIIFNFFIFYII